MSLRTALLILLTSTGVAAAAPRGARAPATAPQDVQVTVRTQQGRLGIAAIQISPDLRAHFGAPHDRGVLVDRVVPNSPADQAGVQPGDVLIELDGAPATSAMDMLDAMSDRKRGDKIAIVAIRDHHRVELAATLASDPMPTRIHASHLRQFAQRFGDLDLEDFFKDIPLPPMPAHGATWQKRLLERLDQLERRLDQLDHQPQRLPGANGPKT